MMGNDSTSLKGTRLPHFPFDVDGNTDDYLIPPNAEKMFEAAMPKLATIGKVIVYGTGGETDNSAKWDFQKLWDKPPSQWP